MNKELLMEQHNKAIQTIFTKLQPFVNVSMHPEGLTRSKQKYVKFHEKMKQHYESSNASSRFDFATYTRLVLQNVGRKITLSEMQKGLTLKGNGAKYKLTFEPYAGHIEKSIYDVSDFKIDWEK